MQKRGELSRLAVNLLIGCLIVVLGVIIFIVVNGWDSVQEVYDDENIDLKISQVKKINDNTLDVTLKRNLGEGEFVGLSFQVSDGSVTEVIRINSSMPENQSGNFSLNFISMNASRIKKISVTPIYLDQDGLEIVGNVKDEYITPNTCSNYCPSGAQCGVNDCGMNCGSGCSSGYLCLNYKCIKQQSSSGGGGGSSGGSSEDNNDETCSDTCSSLGYTCGAHTICGNNVNCGTCSTGYTCSTNSTCIENPSNCTDTCSTFGYNCGIKNICNISTNCGTCSTGFICNLTGLCECNSTCSSLGYQCGTRTVCGNSVNCGTCSTGYTCQTNGTCTQNPCTDTCSSLVKQCGNYTICGNSVNCGTCSSGYTCSTGLCIPSCVPTTCVALQRNCGIVSDGCGGTLTCGSYSGGCQSGYTCQINGTCIKDCTPTTCSALQRTCGTASNGCGGTLNCGTCSTGYSCAVNGTCIKDVVITCNGVTCASREYCSNGVCLLDVSGNTYFVSTNGNDNNPGNFSHPWKTWQKAFNTADAGDIVYFRGGVWYPTESLIIAPRELPGEWGGPYYGHVGTAENPIRYFNYPGEKPILDGRDRIPENYPSMMFFFGAAYVEFKGITVRNVPQYPTSWMAVGIGCSCCSNFKFENMVVHDIGGRGYSWFSCMGYYGITEDTNIWINSDTYNCKDPYSPEPGNGGDCFKTVNEAGAYSIFQGCRAWNCSDDGYDLSGPNTVIVNNSWSFLNGFPGALDGNGFKSGGVNAEVSYPTRIITNNIAANNTGYGYFDIEYDDLHRNNARVYNNLFYSSGVGIVISDNPHYERTLSVYRNNIVYVAHNLDSTSRPSIIDAPFYYTESHNTWDMVDQGSASWWDYASDVTVTNADFVSLDVYQLMRPRKSDGSLPNVEFGHLATGSDLIDAGTQIPSSDDVDLIISYSGSAPDLGPFESNY